MGEFAYRTLRIFLLSKFALVLPFFFLAPSARAELRSGDAIELSRDTDLRRAPDRRSPSLGRLPKGTIATFQGEDKEGYLEVEVELESGSISGWISRTAISPSARGEDAELL